MIMLECPDFPANDKSAFAKVLKLPVKSTRFLLGRCKAMMEKKLQKSKSVAETPIIRELVEHGFKAFDLTPELRRNDKLPVLDESDGTFKTEVFKPRILKRENVVHNPCVDWLSQNLNSAITVTKVVCPFRPREFFQYQFKIIPELKVSDAFALVGLSVPSQWQSSESKKQVHGTVLMEWHKSPTFSHARLVDKLMSYLKDNLGIPPEDIFRRYEFKCEGKAEKKKRDLHFFRTVSSVEVRKFRKMTPDQVNEVKERYREMTTGRRDVPVVNITQDQDLNEPLQVVLNDDLDLGHINNISFLMGTNPHDLKLQELITEETISNCEQKRPFLDGKYNHVNFTQKHTVKVFLDLYAFFANSGFEHMYEHIKESYVACQQAVRNYSALEMATKEPLMCPHCGKLDTEFICAFSLHKRRCKLEHQACKCNQSFSTPNEKRRHMRLVHSGKKYLECQQCSFITPLQKALDNHISYHHGEPGQEKICDLCYKKFRSENHLRIHRFNHERYFCKPCGMEIHGRNTNKSHNMKFHNAGFECDICGKNLYTEKELEVHFNETHSSVWKN